MTLPFYKIIRETDLVILHGAPQVYRVLAEPNPCGVQIRRVDSNLCVFGPSFTVPEDVVVGSVPQHEVETIRDFCALLGQKHWKVMTEDGHNMVSTRDVFCELVREYVEARAKVSREPSKSMPHKSL